MTMLGCVPLLRWAISNDKSDCVASLSVSFACLIAGVIAFGRPGEPFQFGMAAYVYATAAASLLCLLYVLWIENLIARMVLAFVTLAIWCWIMIGMPMEVDMLVKSAMAGYILLVIAGVFIFRTRYEVRNDDSFAGALVALAVISSVLWLYGQEMEDASATNFALALGVISLTSLIWTVKKFGFAFQENAVVILSMSVGGLIWHMWLHGQVPIVALLCLVLVLFTRSAAVKMLVNAPVWLQKGYYFVLFLLCLLPALLSLVFFDILRNL
ncbi:hypothetical protein RYZ26_06635 [Terasakiella sp. A23]|uniref:hypothetical protein n=1 Tax=Terasakiella sp. FCG-A23 TaxID=3080561 RepID=UPI0029533221|nr:hypothetical protein [Terasakiella sp. A23]MDV7339262.1 hypothetical protein [Terasakiella sp. A23]